MNFYTNFLLLILELLNNIRIIKIFKNISDSKRNFQSSEPGGDKGIFWDNLVIYVRNIYNIFDKWDLQTIYGIWYMWYLWLLSIVYIISYYIRLAVMGALAGKSE